MKSFKKIVYSMTSLSCNTNNDCAGNSSRISRRGLSNYNENVNIKGLEQPVKIYHDENGIPHIYATSEHDLYLATGYVMAQERMWQMDLLRRVTLGRLAENIWRRFY